MHTELMHTSTILTGIGPNPISKKDTYEATAPSAVILLKYPFNDNTITMQEANIPAEDHIMRVLRPHRSIRRRAT